MRLALVTDTASELDLSFGIKTYGPRPVTGVQSGARMLPSEEVK
jgi:hypothetical protein